MQKIEPGGKQSVSERRRGSGKILEAYLAHTPGSRKLSLEAKAVLPGGLSTDTRYFEPYGIYVGRAGGVEKWDVDGNRYLDFFGGHGANMLGHSHPVFVDAVRRTVANGIQFAAGHPLEVALARRVQQLIASAQKVRFTGSGTEATLLAIRLARAFTGRKKVVRIASHYHGWHDHAVSGYLFPFDGSPAPGILPDVAAETILVRPGDWDALSRAAERHGREIAAFMAEPVGSHFGVVPTAPEFLESMAGLARDSGALFILDEVLTGFRVGLGGAQAVYGLQPDLTTLAKVLCGGMPGGAVVGRADVLSLLDPDETARCGRPKVLHQGTLTGNPVSMAAGLATIDELERLDGCDRASTLGAYAREALNVMSVAEQLPFAWYGHFSAFHLHIRSDGGYGCSGLDLSCLPIEAFLDRPQPLLNRLRMALNVLGIDVNTKCSGLLSAVHTEGDVDRCIEAVAQAGQMLRREALL
jgi:glutamate-1-semialdehyde 2,1-aminomutase